VASLVDETLAIPLFRRRMGHLRTLRPHYRTELADEFVARAHAVMRCDPREAAQCARFARRIAIETDSEDGRIEALRVYAQACILDSRYPAALRALEDASQALRRQGDESSVAELEILGLQPLIHLERHGEARLAGERCLTAFEKASNRNGLIRAHMALADLAFRLDRPKEALRHYSAVDRLITPESPSRFLGALAANRANALVGRNRFQAADRHFELARELFDATGCNHTVAQVDYNAAYAESLRGRYEESLRRYAGTEETFLRLGDERHLAHTDLDRAEIHVHLNMAAEARTLAARAEERFASLGMEKESAQAAQLAGSADEARGHADEAARCLSRAEAVFCRLGLHERRLSCLAQQASLALGAGERRKARRLTDEATALLEHDPGPLAQATVSLLRALLDLADGKPTEALHAADSVRMDCRRIHAPWIEIESHRLMARAYVARLQIDEAIIAYRRAIEALERYRGGVPPDEYMSAFLAGRSEVYSEIVRLLMRAGRLEAAFEFAERAKSRALVDLLAGRAREGGRAGATWTARRVRHLRESLNAAYQQLFRHRSGLEQRSPGTVEKARQRANELEEEMARLLREARLHDREAASLDTVDAPDLETIRGNLDPGTALVEYFVTADELIIFVATQRELHAVRKGVKESELRSLLERFRFHLAKFDRKTVMAADIVQQATRSNLARLADHLLAPIAGQLRASRLVVVPHGLLHHLPFHALPWGDGWVADRFEVVYAPSAAVYGYCRNKQTSGKGEASVLGLPDRAAPLIESEARQVAAALGSRRLHLGEAATLDRLREEARTARILHLATHGMFRGEQPMFSSIRLADTWVNLYDLYSLELGAELVVLSTCESGVADVTDGDEILGLTRGFLFAGARMLMASQWRVNDRSTAELMTRFYRHLREGVGAGAALKRAMAEIRATRPHPYFWAPFFLTGCPVALPSRDSHTRHESTLLGSRT
jgi:CHAT domain-containing protein